jgi:Sortase domain
MMRVSSILAVAFAVAIVGIAAPSGSVASVPPDRKDPCARAGRDACGTTGVGFYGTYRYGTRWFGDFRAAVPGFAHTFCIDLRFWYASRGYGYRERSATRLRNRSGSPVPLEKQQRMAYAIWQYGQTTKPLQQVAVMLYVHSLMGDARPGELDPAGLGRHVALLYREISRAAARYHGPYRIQTRLSGNLRVGERTPATIRVLAKNGIALAHARLRLSANGAEGVPRQVRTDATGVATVAIVPTAVQVRLRAEAQALPANRPRLFVPTTAAAASNAQRLVAPASQRVAVTIPLRAQPALTGTVSRQLVRPGSPIFERIRVRGFASGTTSVQLELFGPFPTRAKIRCSGRPAWSAKLTVRSENEIRSPAVKLNRAGFYTYRARLSDQALPHADATDCALESSTALAVPSIVAGHADAADGIATPAPSAGAPKQVRIPALGVRAAISPVAIDVRRGVLDLPASIQRAGWWQDGMTPGARSGTILIVAHVDSARAGAGAFFKLRHAKPGEAVQITTHARTYTYRVASLHTYPKHALPTNVYARDGTPRLVLITCGGPFDAATGHYRDNVVVTAVPT